MSAQQMIDMCVRYIAARHNMLTEEHVAMLNEVWDLYEPAQASDVPLPVSPPPEEYDCDDRIRQYGLNCRRFLNLEVEEYEEGACDADRCMYECGAPCGASNPPGLGQTQDQTQDQFIDLTCDEDRCLYGCDYSCGAGRGEYCKAEYAGSPSVELPEIVQAVAQDEDYSDMPALKRVSWPSSGIPSDDTDDEMPPLMPMRMDMQSQPNTSKAKPLFPYNHPMWPSPRAKLCVQYLLRRGAATKQSMSRVLNRPIKTLSNDICILYLAHHYNVTPAELLTMTVRKLHSWPGGEYCRCNLCQRDF